MENNNSVASGAALKAGAWYVVSSVFIKAISIITTPIFTRMLSVSEYGAVATFSSWHSMLSVVFSLNLTYSIGRAKLDFLGDLDNYIGAMQLLSAFVSGAICVFVFVFLKPISSFLELTPFATVLLMSHLFFGSAISFRQNGYRYRYKYKQNIAIAWYIALGTVAMSLILMIVIKNNRSIARMAGLAIPSVALGIVFWLQSIKKDEIHLNKEYFRYGLRLSGPLILHTISLNILAQSDRIFIAKIGTSSDVGIYSLVYNYGVLMHVIMGAVSDGWLPWFHDNYFAKKFDAIKQNSKKIVLLGCFLGLASIGLAPEAIRILGGENYMNGIYCVPPVAIGILCQYIYTHYVNIELHHKKTEYVSLGTICAALLNIILNAIFIPLYGYVAAAYTTMFSYLCLLFVHYFITRKILKVNLYQNVFMFAAVFISSMVAILLVATYNHGLIRYALVAVGFSMFLLTFKSYICGFIQTKVETKVKA